MITSNVISRIFYIAHNSTSGTAFTIEIDGRQYLISARHIFEHVHNSLTVSIFHETQWKDIDLRLIGHGAEDIDISVLSADFQLSPTHQLEPTSRGIAYGQDVYFLGFPYGTFGKLGKINRNFPLPFVKKGILSAMQMMSVDKSEILYIDGHNNPGFSGGPVIFKQPNSNNFKVAAVISGYQWVPEPVYMGDVQTKLSYQYNTGIIVSYGIRHAVDIIRSNPYGFSL